MASITSAPMVAPRVPGCFRAVLSRSLRSSAAALWLKKGRRQKAKSKRQKGGRRKIEDCFATSSAVFSENFCLLPFAFCLLPSLRPQPTTTASN
ncbi:MAG: hypothetical protein SF182_18845 [Deltaproteobacteria bacterium]|nr:hypothetical protein [Deltaproteobacteria bacterium]